MPELGLDGEGTELGTDEHIAVGVGKCTGCHGCVKGVDCEGEAFFEVGVAAAAWTVVINFLWFVDLGDRQGEDLQSVCIPSTKSVVSLAGGMGKGVHSA